MLGNQGSSGKKNNIILVNQTENKLAYALGDEKIYGETAEMYSRNGKVQITLTEISLDQKYSHKVDINDFKDVIVDPKYVKNPCIPFIQAITYSLIESCKGDSPTNYRNENVKHFVIFNIENDVLEQITNEDKLRSILPNCYEVKNWHDYINLICDTEKLKKNDTYLVINMFIFIIRAKDLYTYMIGRIIEDPTKEQKQTIKKIVMGLKKRHSYPKMQNGLLEVSNKWSFVRFVKHMLIGDYTSPNPNSSAKLEIEAWHTLYFTASIICESARNFNVIPLIIMALDMFESIDPDSKNIGIAFFFENHPMARGGSWIDPSRCGYSGSVTPEGSSKIRNKKKSSETTEALGKDHAKLFQLKSLTFSKWISVIGKKDPLKALEDIAVRFNILPDTSMFLKIASIYLTFFKILSECQ